MTSCYVYCLICTREDYLICTREDYSILQEDINSISNLATANLMTFNTSKCKCMLISRKRDSLFSHYTPPSKWLTMHYFCLGTRVLRNSAGGTFIRIYVVCIIRNVHARVKKADNSITLIIILYTLELFQHLNTLVFLCLPTYSGHIQDVCTKARKIISLLYRQYYQYSDPSTLLHLYH